MKKLLFIIPILLGGCLATENRRIPMRLNSSVAPITTQPWWRTPYYAQDKYNSPWDAFVPAPQVDPLEAELRFFERNVIKWPKTMPPAYKPTRSEKAKPVGEPIQGEVY